MNENFSWEKMKKFPPPVPPTPPPRPLHCQLFLRRRKNFCCDGILPYSYFALLFFFSFFSWILSWMEVMKKLEKIEKKINTIDHLISKKKL